MYAILILITHTHAAEILAHRYNVLVASGGRGLFFLLAAVVAVTPFRRYCLIRIRWLKWRSLCFNERRNRILH